MSAGDAAGGGAPCVGDGGGRGRRLAAAALVIVAVLCAFAAWRAWSDTDAVDEAVACVEAVSCVRAIPATIAAREVTADGAGVHLRLVVTGAAGRHTLEVAPWFDGDELTPGAAVRTWAVGGRWVRVEPVPARFSYPTRADPWFAFGMYGAGTVAFGSLAAAVLAWGGSRRRRRLAAWWAMGAAATAVAFWLLGDGLIALVVGYAVAAALLAVGAVVARARRRRPWLGREVARPHRTTGMPAATLQRLCRPADGRLERIRALAHARQVNDGHILDWDGSRKELLLVLPAGLAFAVYFGVRGNGWETAITGGFVVLPLATGAFLALTWAGLVTLPAHSACTFRVPLRVRPLSEADRGRYLLYPARSAWLSLALFMLLMCGWLLAVTAGAAVVAAMLAAVRAA